MQTEPVEVIFWDVDEPMQRKDILGKRQLAIEYARMLSENPRYAVLDVVDRHTNKSIDWRK